MTKLVSIDHSSHGAHYVVVDSNLRRAEIISCGSVKRGADEDASMFWERVVERLPQDIDTIAVTADGSATSTRILNFPFGDLRKVEQTIQFELETQIPYDIDDVLLCWHVTSRHKSRTAVLAAMTPKAKLQAQLQELSAASLEPRAIVVPGAVLGELLPAGTAGTTAVVSVGAQQTHVSVLQGNTLAFTRTVRAGGDTIDRALAKALNVSVDDARRIKETRSSLYIDDDTNAEDRRLAEVATESLGPLVSQLAATFKSLPPDIMPTRLLLTGGSTRLAGLAEVLQQRLGLPVELLDLKASLGAVTSTTPLGPELAVAVGLALATLRHGRSLTLNLRTGEFAFKGDLELYRGELKRVIIGVAAVLALAMFASVVRYSMVTSRERELDQGICNATKKIFGREYCDPTTARSMLSSAAGQEGGVFIPNHSAATLFEMISKAIPSSTQVSFQTLEFKLDAGQDVDRISGKGEAESFEATEHIVASLEKDPCVKQAEISKQKRGTSNRVEFNLEVSVQCPPGTIPGQALGPVASATPLPSASPKPGGAAPNTALEGAKPPAAAPAPTQRGTTPAPLMPTAPPSVDESDSPTDVAPRAVEPAGVRNRLERSPADRLRQLRSGAGREARLNRHFGDLATDAPEEGEDGNPRVRRRRPPIPLNLPEDAAPEAQ